MQKTENYGFNKPESTDYYNVDNFNENMDIIDEKLKSVEETSSNAETTINEHLNADNPHNITKTTVGLSNVPNVATNNQTPTYSVANSVSELSSGEKLSTAFGKIAKAVATLISHMANKSNPHEVTATQIGALMPANVVDDLNSDKDNMPLSANQGRVLKETLDSMFKLITVSKTVEEIKTTTGVTLDFTSDVPTGYTLVSCEVNFNGSGYISVHAVGRGGGKYALKSIGTNAITDILAVGYLFCVKSEYVSLT